MKLPVLFLALLCAFQLAAQSKKIGPSARQNVLIADTAIRLRGLADTIGFAHTRDQIETVMQKIDQSQSARLARIRSRYDISNGDNWRLAIAPHDDYAYAGYMYPLVLKNVQSKVVVIFGVAHKAKKFGIDNVLVFDSYTHWRGPYGTIKVSGLRKEIEKELSPAQFVVHDSLQSAEHSVEAELPFLQYFNREVEIISILVPAMPYSRMQELAVPLGKALAKVFKKHDLEWGTDVSLLISSDAVHYGDEEWNGSDFAFFGTDSLGYNQAVAREKQIINQCLEGDLLSAKVQLFTRYTVQDNDYKTYKWTWCGRYSVPFGMLAALQLQTELPARPLQGMSLDYCTSIDHPLLQLDNTGMGTTAKAYMRHWVGYPCIVFR